MGVTKGCKRLLSILLVTALVLPQAGPVLAGNIPNADTEAFTVKEQADFEDGTLGGFVKLNGSANVNAINKTAEDGNHYLEMSGAGDGDRSYAKSLAAPTTSEQVLVSFDWLPGTLTAKTRSSEFLIRATMEPSAAGDQGTPLFRFVKHGDGSIRFDTGKSGIDLSTTQTVTGVTYEGWLSAQVLFDFEEEKIAFEIHDKNNPQNRYSADKLDISGLAYMKSIAKLELRGNRAGTFTTGLDNLTIKTMASAEIRNVASITTAYENQLFKLPGTTVNEVVYGLPAVLSVGLTDGSRLEEVPVSWSSTDYNPDQLGTYTFNGLLDVSGFPQVKNNNNIQARITVQVVKDLNLPAPHKGAALYAAYAAEGFEYPGLVGSALPLQDAAYGSWTYKGTDKPLVRILQGTSGNYAELLKDPGKSTGVLGKEVQVSQAEKLYLEFSLRLPHAGSSSNSQEEISAGFFGDAVDETPFAGIKVKGTQLFYTVGGEETVIRDLAGTPLTVDPEAWYKFVLYADFSGETAAHHVRIRILRMRATVVIGPTTDHISQVASVFEKAKSATRYRSFENENQILDMEQPDLFFETGSFNYPFAVERELIQALRAGEREEAVRQLTLFVEVMSAEGMKEIDVQQGLMRLLAGILNAVSQVGVNPASLTHGGNIFEALSQIRDPQSILQWFRENIVETYMKELEKRSNDQVKRMIELAKQYLQEYYAKDISLESCADHVGATSHLLSKAFKYEVGINFTEYLTELRMDKAKALLKDSDIMINEIALLVGYQPSYFIRLFKKLEGITPGRFRELVRGQEG